MADHLHVTCISATPAIRRVPLGALRSHPVAMTDPTKRAAQEMMGRRLRQVREALGLTQEQMALAVGVVPATIAGWENGRNMLDAVALAKAAARYDFTADWVLLGKIGSLPHELASKIQLAQMAAANSPGKPTRRPLSSPRAKAPKPPIVKPPATLHERPAPFAKTRHDT